MENFYSDLKAKLNPEEFEEYLQNSIKETIEKLSASKTMNPILYDNKLFKEAMSGKWKRIGASCLIELFYPECKHELVEYIGFSETYFYCKKCDHKVNKN